MQISYDNEKPHYIIMKYYSFHPDVQVVLFQYNYNTVKCQTVEFSVVTHSCWIQYISTATNYIVFLCKNCYNTCFSQYKLSTL